MSTTELSRVITATLFKPDAPYEIEKIKTRKELDPFIDRAKDIEIKDNEDKQIAINLGQVLIVGEKSVKEQYGPFKKSIDAIKQSILNDENYELDRIFEAKERLSKLITVFNEEQDKIIAEQNAIALAEAQKEEEERKLNDAIALEESGDLESAEAVLDEESLPPPVITQTPQKMKGEVNRGTWYAEVTDLKALIRDIADGNVPLEVFIPNQKFLNTKARDLRQGLNYAGVVAKRKTKTTFRS
jgi:hypothetical protein